MLKRNTFSKLSLKKKYLNTKLTFLIKKIVYILDYE